jgi:hypothetical protein
MLRTPYIAARLLAASEHFQLRAISRGGGGSYALEWAGDLG